jgi:dienelactone hydrolase
MHRAAVATLSLTLAACTANEAASPLIVHEEAAVPSGDAHLAATISFPDDGRRHPAVVVVHGSGRITRDQLRRNWERLVPEGMVVLTYDKRGVGPSTGEFVAVGTRTSEGYMPVLAGDALECLRVLRRHPRVDPARVGFLGASQAGWIIPLALSKAAPDEAAFAIILSGPATSVGLEMEYSRLTGDGVREAEPLAAEAIERRLAEYSGPHGLDTVPLLARLRTKTLWLLGDRDASIPIGRTQQNLERVIASGAPITVKTYPGADHGLGLGGGRAAPFWEDALEWMRTRRILQ